MQVSKAASEAHRRAACARNDRVKLSLAAESRVAIPLETRVPGMGTTRDDGPDQQPAPSERAATRPHAIHRYHDLLPPDLGRSTDIVGGL